MATDLKAELSGAAGIKRGSVELKRVLQVGGSSARPADLSVSAPRPRHCTTLVPTPPSRSSRQRNNYLTRPSLSMTIYLPHHPQPLPLLSHGMRPGRRYSAVPSTTCFSASSQRRLPMALPLQSRRPPCQTRTICIWREQMAGSCALRDIAIVFRPSVLLSGHLIWSVWESCLS